MEETIQLSTQKDGQPFDPLHKVTYRGMQGIT